MPPMSSLPDATRIIDNLANLRVLELIHRNFLNAFLIITAIICVELAIVAFRVHGGETIMSALFRYGKHRRYRPEHTATPVATPAMRTPTPAPDESQYTLEVMYDTKARIAQRVRDMRDAATTLNKDSEAHIFDIILQEVATTKVEQVIKLGSDILKSDDLLTKESIQKLMVAGYTKLVDNHSEAAANVANQELPIILMRTRMAIQEVDLS